MTCEQRKNKPCGYCGCSIHKLLNDIHIELKETLKQGVGLSRVEKLIPKIDEFLDERKNMP